MSVPYRPPDRSDDRTAGYWEGFEAGEIRLPRCRDCEAYHWYPKHVCPDCGSDRVRWTAVSGEATLFTWVEVAYHFDLPFLRDRVPIRTGLVLPIEDESIRLAAAIRTPDGVAPEIGMALEATFLDGEGTPVPVYEPR